METKLSSEYWNLHRNSLLFSSALFLACLITTADEFNVLGLKLGNLGAGAVGFLLLIASTYCIIALYLEWKEEPRRAYRTLRTTYADKMSVLNGQVALLADAQQKMSESIDNLNYAATKFGSNYNRVDDQALEEVYRVVHEETKNQIRSRFMSPSLADMSPDEAQRRNALADTIINELEDIVEGRASILKGIVDYHSGRTATSIATAVAGLSDQVSKLCAQLSALPRFAAWASLSVRLDLFWSWVRLVGFGFLLPLLLYFNGVLHCIGRLWWHDAPVSWIIPLLKGMH
jgi:hypothetical protein